MASFGIPVAASVAAAASDAKPSAESARQIIQFLRRPIAVSDRPLPLST